MISSTLLSIPLRASTSACSIRTTSSSSIIYRSFNSSSSHQNQLPHSTDDSAPFNAPTPLPTASELKTSATRVAEQTMRRFWKTVNLRKHESTKNFPFPHYTVDLDNRSLRTPEFAVLRVPLERPLLAALIANEWQEQNSILKPHTLPLTSLVARSIDGLATEEQRSKVCDDLMKYFETDTICFFEDNPQILVSLQSSHWTPLLQWARSRFKIPISLFQDQLLSVSQQPEATKTLRSYISKFNSLELAALERSILSTKSFLIGLALLEGEIDLEMACQATEVEVRSQIQRWGEVEDTHDVDAADLRVRLGSVGVALCRE